MDTASPNEYSLPEPASAEAQNHLGIALAMKGRLDEAIVSFNRAIQLNEGFAAAYSNLANALRGKGRTREAIAVLRRAIELNPEFTAAHNNLGIVLRDAGQLDEAIGAYRRAIEIDPNNADAQCNLGITLSDRDLLDEAIIAYRRAVEIRPDFAEAFNNLGTALKDNAQLEEAVGAFDRAIELNPPYAAAHWNRALTWLLLGDYRRGWAEYEWRLEVPSIVGTRKFDRPRWDGSDPAGKTIFLHPEQGFGDMIQFVRFIPRLIERGAKVILESPPELVRIFHGFGEVLNPGQLIPPHDVHCPLMSLAGIFGVTAESIPAPIPYLKPEPRWVAEWSRRFDSNDDRLRVGLVWGGRGTHSNDRNRSMKLGQFAPLASVAKAAFYSLQKGAASAEAPAPPPGMQLTDWTKELGDFADTAALLQNLDLLITADTAVAHLAGAMGKPVWVLTPAVPDWRWMLEREDSPWYPTMRLFRQKSAGDWPDVLRRVATELAKTAALSSQK